MITEDEQRWIRRHAYVPEHMTAYVSPVSGAEPFFQEPFLYYVQGRALIFIGYPLGEPFSRRAAKNLLDGLIRQVRPERVAVTAPETMLPEGDCLQRSSDRYYRLDLLPVAVPSKVRNMVCRASREVVVRRGPAAGREHGRLIAEFIEARRIEEPMASLLRQIPAYVAFSATSCALEARDRQGRLVAYDVAETDAEQYAFHLFHLSSRRWYVPGASDLLFSERIAAARREGKPHLQMGLGIHAGLMFFKTKWGGVPFLPYEYCLVARTTPWRFLSLFPRFS